PGGKGKIDPNNPQNNPKWAKHAVSGFLAGQYFPKLLLHPTDPAKDDVVLHPMPTVVMKPDGTGTVTLVVTMARAQNPQDAEDGKFDVLAREMVSTTVKRTDPRHPRNGAIPARHV